MKASEQSLDTIQLDDTINKHLETEPRTNAQVINEELIRNRSDTMPPPLSQRSSMT